MRDQINSKRYIAITTTSLKLFVTKLRRTLILLGINCPIVILTTPWYSNAKNQKLKKKNKKKNKLSALRLARSSWADHWHIHGSRPSRAAHEPRSAFFFFLLCLLQLKPLVYPQSMCTKLGYHFIVSRSRVFYDRKHVRVRLCHGTDSDYRYLF